MKRKLLNGVMLLTALAGVGTFTSCKDYDSEQLEQQQTNQAFDEKLTSLKTQLDALKNAHDTFEQTINSRVDALERDLLAKLGDKVDKTTFDNTVAELRRLIADACQCQGGITEAELKQKVESIVNAMMQATGPGSMQDTIQQWISDAILGTVQDLATLESTVRTLETNVTNLTNDIQTIKDRIDALEASGLTREQAVQIAQEEAGKVFDTKIQVVKTQLESLESKINGMQGQIDTINTTIGTINNNISNLSTSLNETEKKAAEALALAQENKAYIETLGPVVTFYETWKDKLPQVEMDVNSLKTNVSDLRTQVSEIEAKIGDINDLIANLATKEEFNKLMDRVKANEDAILVLQGQVNKLQGLEDRLNSLITSVEVQGVYNPLFGSFSLPFGVQSNMLVNYYGQFDGQSLTFPSTNESRSYDNTPALTQEEYANIINAGFKEADAITLNNGDYLTTGVLGKLFMTINPNNVNFTGGNLTLERSNGVPAEVQVNHVKRSTEELKFGYTRADNGFYEADVYMPATAKAISSIQLEIAPGLAGAVKNFVKEHNRPTAFQLLRKVYDQLAIGLPAYGLRAGWTANGKDYATFSKYEISTVTFSPLSYASAYGITVNKKLPTHSPIDEAILNINSEDYHFNLKDIQVNVNKEAIKDGIKFELEKLDVNDFDGKLYVILKGITLKDEAGVEFTVGTDDPIYLDKEGIKDFIDQMNSQIDGWNEDMNESLENVIDTLADEIDRAVKGALEDMEKEVNDKIDQIVDDINNKVGDRVSNLISEFNKFLDLYNKVANKINGWLDDPNHLLQPTILYTAGDHNLHHLSSSFQHPSVFKINGGSGVELYLTSYTAEIFAPAYKKFVAIAGAWDANGNKDNSADFRALNKGGNLLTVLDGNSRRLALPTGQMKKGYKYELVYTCLDYKGYTSTQRFYITVK